MLKKLINRKSSTNNPHEHQDPSKSSSRYKSSSKPSDIQYRSVLDLPFDHYAVDNLPGTIKLCDKSGPPLVSIQQVKDHLHVLQAFHSCFPVENQASASSSTSAPTPTPASTSPSENGAQPKNGLKEICQAAALAYIRWVDEVLTSRPSDKGPLTEGEVPSLPALMAWHSHLLNPHWYDSGLSGRFQALKGIDFPLTQLRSRNWDFPSSSEEEFSLGHRSEPLDELTREIGEAIERQSIFVRDMFKITWLDHGHFDKDVRELQIGIVRYHAWLDLMWSKDCKEFLVPTLDIDLAWHTHQLCHEKYKEDTQRLIGKFLNHSDNAGKEKRGKGFDNTGTFWKERFGYPY